MDRHELLMKTYTKRELATMVLLAERQVSANCDIINLLIKEESQ